MTPVNVWSGNVTFHHLSFFQQEKLLLPMARDEGPGLWSGLTVGEKSSPRGEEEGGVDSSAVSFRGLSPN